MRALTEDEIIRQLKKRMVPVVDQMAVELEAAVKLRIQLSDEPSDPGESPHSPGPYRDSIHRTPARIIRGDLVRAQVFSLAKAGTHGELSLGFELEYGGANAPRPHWRPAVRAVSVTARARVRQALRP